VEQLEAQRPTPLSELEALRAELAQSQSEVDSKLRAQDAELQKLQQRLKDLEAQARRAETTTNQRLEERTDVVLDTMTEHFDVVFEEVKAAVETLSWKVANPANEVGWLTQNHPGSVSELVADLEQAAAADALHRRRRRTQEGEGAAPRAHEP
jgi:chromosome segregation ATPase